MRHDRDEMLLTGAQRKLLQASKPPRLAALEAPQLKSHLRRARALADKYRDVTRRRHRSSKRDTSQGRRPTETLRMERKAKLFVKAARRFERQLSRVNTVGSTARTDPRGRKSSGRSGRGMTTQRDTLRRRRQRRRTAGESAQALKAKRHFQQKGVRTIQGHIRARTRRHQAKRDARS